MKILKLMMSLLAALVLMLGGLGSGSIGKQEYTKKEKKPCTYCHSSKNPKDYSEKDLTDAGKYYKEKKDAGRVQTKGELAAGSPERGSCQAFLPVGGKT